jgi:hypothetical protein
MGSFYIHLELERGLRIPYVDMHCDRCICPTSANSSEIRTCSPVLVERSSIIKAAVF